MKKRLKISAAFLLGVVLFWCILVWTGVFMSPKEFKAAVAKIAARVEPTIAPAPSAGAVPGQIIVEDQGVQRPEGMSAEDWKRYLRIHATMIKSNHPAAIYMKFIDQHGQPVQGLKVNFRIVGGEDSIAKVLAGSPLQRVEKVPKVSDAAGMIEIEGKRATSFGVDFPSQPEFKLGRGHGPFRFGSLLEAANSPEIFRPDKNKPLIYRIWRRGLPKPTYYWTTLHGKLSVKTKEKFLARFCLVYQEPRVEPVPEASLDIAVEITSRPPGGTPEWTCTLTAVEGGLAKAPDSDEHGCLAPEEGYLKSFTVTSKDPKAPGGGWIYFRSANRKIHSSFRLTSSLGIEDGLAHAALVEVTTDTIGSREVEHTPGVVNYLPYKK